MKKNILTKKNIYLKNKDFTVKMFFLKQKYFLFFIINNLVKCIISTL